MDGYNEVIDMSMITEQVKRLKEYADNRKGEISNICREAASTISDLSEKLHAANMERSRWISITYRHMTEEEKKSYAERTGYDIEDLDTMLDCPLPEDGEIVLITDRLGNVCTDVFYEDCDRSYFECNEDMKDVIAWMPLPTPYSESSK